VLIPFDGAIKVEAKVEVQATEKKYALCLRRCRFLGSPMKFASVVHYLTSLQMTEMLTIEISEVRIRTMRDPRIRARRQYWVRRPMRGDLREDLSP
jgi:hypothetical protein